MRLALAHAIVLVMERTPQRGHDVLAALLSHVLSWPRK